VAINSGSNVNPGNAGGLAVDAASVNDLKRLTAQSPNSPAAIKGAAKQFEAMFLNMVMKSMRDATPQNGIFDSEQSKMFQSMLDQQMSQTLAQRGIGLAEVLTRQLSANAGKGADPAADTQDGQTGAARSLLSPGMLGAQGESDQSLLGLPVNQALMNADRDGSSGNKQRRPPRPAHVEAFQNALAADAEEASKTTGIPAKFMMAQAALESGWGKHVIHSRDGGSSHNLFGIKATAGWKGKVVEATTTEYVNGVATRKVEKFRAYDSYADSFRDYASMLRSNPRYEKVLASAQDMNGFAHGLQRAGYATDPRYAEKLASIIRQT
jgi:flagellar protein FlgJ